MIALLALCISAFGDEPVVVASVQRLLSVDHACNTLQLRNIDAYGAGSRGWGIFVSSRNEGEAVSLLRQDASAYPQHYFSIGDEFSVKQNMPSEVRRPLNVSRESLSTLVRDPNMYALVKTALQYARESFFREDEDVFVPDVYLIPIEYRSKDGTMRTGYSARIQLAVRGKSRAKGELRIDVWEEGKSLQIFGGWADS
jgi:hypothetical protein